MAVAAPMPALAPVIKTIFPFKRMCALSYRVLMCRRCSDRGPQGYSLLVGCGRLSCGRSTPALAMKSAGQSLIRRAVVSAAAKVHSWHWQTRRRYSHE